jgi:hypothetical protein
MAQQSQINTEVFSRINDLETDVSETKGYLKAIVCQNEKMMAMLQKRDASTGRIIWALFGIIIILLFALIYGAIGEKGLHSVRSAVPSRVAAIPAPGDLDRWIHGRRPA